MFKGRLAGIGVGTYTSDAHKQLDHAVPDVEGLASVLGAVFEGEPLRNPTEGQARDYLRSLRGTLPADSVLVVAWSGHGSLPASGGLRLLGSDSGPYASDGVPLVDVVLPCAESGANQLLFFFDTCYSGDAISADDLATLIMRETQAAGRVWVGVVTSCLPPEKARDGLFGQRLRKVLAAGPDLPELRMRWSVHNEYVRGDDVCDAVLKEWGSGAQTPDFRSRGSAWWMFPNPLYEAGAPEQVVEHLLRAARSGDRSQEQSWFTGRTAEVNRVVEWVQEGLPGLHVVTGSAGTGKSAILGRVVSLSNPDERQRLLTDGHEWSHVLPEERSVAAHVHARGLTADLAADHLADHLVRAGLLTAREARRNASELVGEVQRAVEDGAKPPVLVLDGLDEARDEAFKIADELLTRLAAYAVVVVSTRDRKRTEEGRPGLVATLAPEGAGIDLDDPEVRRQGQGDLREYVRLRLRGVDQRMDAAAVAGHLFGEDAAEVQHSFLLARLVADQLTAAPVDTSQDGWEDKVSHSVEEALDADLAAVPAQSAHRAKSLLRALTWAFGAGFPEQEWLAVANVEAPDGVEVTREDISWVLEQLGRHVVQDGEGGVAVYRMAHQSLADHLRPAFRASAEQPFDPRAFAVAEALLGLYREHLAVGIPAVEPAYLWLYAWRHAAEAGPDGLALLRSLAEVGAALLPDVGMAATFVADRFEHWGKAGEALPPAKEAAGLYDRLAAVDPTLLPDLASALDNLGTHYSNLGRHADALDTSEQAVDLYRALAEDNPAHLPDLASALNNLGTHYSSLGRHTDALEPTEQAIRLYHILAEDNPAHLADLASALNNLGTHYGNLGRHTDALDTAEEALDLYGTHAADNSAHLRYVASVLNNLGNHYSNLGRHTDALDANEQAVELYRTLAEDNPVHLPDLAAGLNNLGNRYRNLGRHTDALDATEQAVHRYRALAEDNPAHLPEFAMSLYNLGNRYSNLGHPANALPPTREAIAHYRALAEDNPVHLPELARALGNLGTHYSSLGHHTEALGPAEEALALYRSLTEDNPAHLPDLAASLNNLGAHYSELDRQTEALGPAEEALALYRALAEDNPAHLPELAGALGNLGAHYSGIGRHSDAQGPTEEAVALYRTLADDNPAHLPDLAMALTNLGTHYSSLDRHADALDTANEGVGLFRSLAEDNPAHLPDFAMALTNLGIRYRNLDRHADALDPTKEAVALYRTLTKDNPAYLPDLADALNNLGCPSSELGGSTEGLWTEIFSEVSPDAAAYLLVYRSSYALAGTSIATAWLAKAEQSEAAAEAPGLVRFLHWEARRHRAADAEAFDRDWRRLTGGPLPAWLTLDPHLLLHAEAWIATESYNDERQHLAAHPELLQPEADICVEEALLSVTSVAAERYRDLRRAAQSDGVDAAYRPLMSSILAYKFATAEPADQRALLDQRRDDLLDDLVFEALSSAAESPQKQPVFIRAHYLLTLARLNAEASAFDALSDASRFPALLHEAARQPNPAVLEATGFLAFTAASDEALTAEAEFHLAIAAAISGDEESAATRLNDACNAAPDQVPTWITAVAEIAPHHEAALTLIPHLTARLQNPSDPDDH